MFFRFLGIRAGSSLSFDRFAFDLVQHDRLIGVVFEHERLVCSVRRDIRRHRHFTFAPAIAAEEKFNEREGRSYPILFGVRM